MRELHLFAGAGGGILGGILLGHTCVCAVEIEPYCRKVLFQRQRDGILPKFPIWDDVCTFSGTEWRGKVDILCGGFPCQDISSAGKGKGITGERSGLWNEMARIIGEVRPRYAFMENSPMLTSRGLGVVLRDLAEMGYDAEWGVLGACDTYAPHKRERIWILAYTNLHERGNEGGNQLAREEQRIPSECGEVLEHANGKGLQGAHKQPKEPWIRRHITRPSEGNRRWWTTEPGVGRVVDGMARRVDRLKALGNGQVSSVVRLAWRILNAQD